MDQVHYAYWIDETIVAIEDLDGPHSVTACAEQVVAGIQKAEGCLEGKLILWCDTEGVWDGMYPHNGQIKFYSLNERTYPAAKAKVLALSEEQCQTYRFAEAFSRPFAVKG